MKTSKIKRAVIIALNILGCLLILVFGLRALHAFRKFSGSPHPPPSSPGEVETDVERIRDWMTVPFIAHMYGVPAEILFEALGIPEEGNRKKNLGTLNREYFPQSDGRVEKIVKDAILAHQSPPTPEAPTLPDAKPTPPSP